MKDNGQRQVHWYSDPLCATCMYDAFFYNCPANVTFCRQNPAKIERTEIKENLEKIKWFSTMAGNRKDFSEKYLSEGKDGMPGTKSTQWTNRIYILETI